jgi:hypothetical protein
MRSLRSVLCNLCQGYSLPGQDRLRLPLQVFVKKALRTRQRRFDKDEINPSDLTYTARGFGIASDVADVLADWNESYPNYPMSDKEERLGLGKGTKITWVELHLA